MTTAGFGDLARSVPLARQGVKARADLARLGQALTTGRHDDVARAEGGDLRRVAGLERALALAGRAEGVTRALQGRLDTMQAGLEGVRRASHEAGRELMTLANPEAAAGMSQAATASRAALGAVVSALSTRIAGVHLFAGAAADAPPLPGMEAMLAGLRADVGAIPDAQGLRAAVQAWFAPGGGMDARWPRPGGDERVVAPLAPGESVEIEATAAHPALRAAMGALALGVLAGEGAGLGREAQREAIRLAGTALIADEAGVTALRGRLGIAEGQSERALARTRAEMAALEIARGQALEVDRHETATRFQAAEAALETLYLATARLSGLSLAKYLR